jgi:hypothetical protein
MPRFGWNMQNCKESQPYVVESLLVDAGRNAYRFFHVWANSVPPKSVERYSGKSATNSSFTSKIMTVVHCLTVTLRGSDSADHNIYNMCNSYIKPLASLEAHINNNSHIDLCSPTSHGFLVSTLFSYLNYRGPFYVRLCRYAAKRCISSTSAIMK